MSQPRAVLPPVVSLQAHGASDPGDGHLATGLLVHPSMVLVPAPPEALLDRTGRFEVLIFPARPAADDPLIERIPPLGITVPFSADGQPPLGTTIRLARPSRNALSIRREPGSPKVNARALELKLAEGHDLWTALSSLRAISPAMRRAPSKALWSKLVAAEGDPLTRRAGHPDAQAGRPGKPRPATPSMQAFGFNACLLFPWWCSDDD